MFALALNGSPRKGGNTETLLHQVLEPLIAAGWETEYVQVGGKLVAGCKACNVCRKKKNLKCAIETDGFNAVFEKILRADAIILGSPTYFTDITAELKAIIDRAGYVAGANGNALAGKVGAAVMAVRRGGATHGFDTLNHLFLKCNMIVPGSTYWNMGYGLEPKDVRNDEEGMNNMRNLGQMIAWLANAIHPHLASLPK